MQRTSHNSCIQVIAVFHNNMIYDILYSYMGCVLLFIVSLGPGKRTEPVYIYNVQQHLGPLDLASVGFTLLDAPKYQIINPAKAASVDR